MKTLEKDRQRRYESVNELAADVQRHLDHEPVLAGRPSAIYKIQKFVKRNRIICIASVAFAILVILAAIVSSHQAWIARKARRAESEARRHVEAAYEQEQQAKQEAHSSLYDSLVREASATRLVRRPGYRNEVFKTLKQANSLDVPQKDLVKLRSEAIACLGDFVGLQPKKVLEFADDPNTPFIYWAAIHPLDPIAAFGMYNGTMVVKDLESAQEIARFNNEHPPRGIYFSTTGDALLSLNIPSAPTGGRQFSDAAVHLFIRKQDGTWGRERLVEVPGARQIISTTKGFYISVVNEESHSIEIRELTSENTVHRLEYPEQMDYPPIIDVSADARLLAAVTVDQNNQDLSAVRIWDLVADKDITCLETGFMSCECLRFSPDGLYLAFLSRAGGIIYSTQRFEPVSRMKQQFTGGSEATFVPDSSIVIFNRGSGPEPSKLEFWDLDKNKYVARIDKAGGRRASSVSADGKYLLALDWKVAWQYTLDASVEKLSLSGHSAGVPGIAFDPDGSHLASVGKDRKLRVWNSNTGSLEWECTLTGLGESVSYSANGQLIVTSEFVSGDVCIWDSKTGEQLLRIESEQKLDVWSAHLCADNRHLVTATEGYSEKSGAVTIWDCGVLGSSDTAPEFEAKEVDSWSGNFKGLEMAPDGQHFAFAGNVEFVGSEPEMKLYLWEFPSSTRPRLIAENLFDSGQMVTFTADSRQLILVHFDGTAATYDVSTEKKVTCFPTSNTGHHIYRKPSLSPDGTKLALCSNSERKVEIWHRESGQLLYTLPERRGRIYRFVWSPDSQRLAVSGEFGEIDIWNFSEAEHVLSDLGLGL